MMNDESDGKTRGDNGTATIGINGSIFIDFCSNYHKHHSVYAAMVAPASMKLIKVNETVYCFTFLNVGGFLADL